MKKNIIFPALLLFCMMFASCNQPEEKLLSTTKNSYLSVEDTLYLPFDTARVLSLYNIQTTANQLPQFRNETDPKLKRELDTIEVTYMNFACDCPNWYELSKKPENAAPSMSPDYGYYIEPASKELELTDRIRQCTVRLIGRHYSTQGWPKDFDRTDPNPPTGNVFRYYSYEMVLPAEIWGPYYHTGERETPSSKEESIMSTVLILRK